MLSCRKEAAVERRDFDVLPSFENDLKEAIKEYRLKFPSEAKLLTNNRWET